MHPAYQRAHARVITYPMKNQQPRAKTAAGIISISDKEPSKSDTGFSECLGIRRHGQEQIKLMAASLESYPWGKARLVQSVGAANLKGNAPLSRSFS